jgi:hypothetical protein
MGPHASHEPHESYMTYESHESYATYERHEPHESHESYATYESRESCATRKSTEGRPHSLTQSTSRLFYRHPDFHTTRSGLRIEFFGVTLEKARRIGRDFIARVREPFSPNRIDGVPEP